MTVQDQALTKALAILKAIDAKYKIVLTDGTELGDLEVVASPKKRQFTYAYGTLSVYLKKHLSDVKVGTVVEIPFGEFDAEKLRACIASICSKRWGNDTYTTKLNRSSGNVELLRYL